MPGIELQVLAHQRCRAHRVGDFHRIVSFVFLGRNLKIDPVQGGTDTVPDDYVALVVTSPSSNSIIWDFDHQHQAICLNLNGEREEGAAGRLSLGEIDERPDVGIGFDSEFKPAR